MSLLAFKKSFAGLFSEENQRKCGVEGPATSNQCEIPAEGPGTDATMIFSAMAAL